MLAHQGLAALDEHTLALGQGRPCCETGSDERKDGGQQKAGDHAGLASAERSFSDSHPCRVQALRSIKTRVGQVPP